MVSGTAVTSPGSALTIWIGQATTVEVWGKFTQPAAFGLVARFAVKPETTIQAGCVGSGSACFNCPTSSRTRVTIDASQVTTGVTPEALGVQEALEIGMVK